MSRIPPYKTASRTRLHTGCFGDRVSETQDQDTHRRSGGLVLILGFLAQMDGNIVVNNYICSSDLRPMLSDCLSVANDSRV
jgi:hypothetical protein